MWPIEQSQLRLKGENTHYCGSNFNDLLLLHPSSCYFFTKDKVDDHKTPDLDLIVYGV